MHVDQPGHVWARMRLGVAQLFGQNLGEIIHQFSEVPFTKPIGSGVVVTNHVSYGFSPKRRQ